MRTASELRKGDTVVRRFVVQSVSTSPTGDLIVETREEGAGLLSFCADPERKFEVEPLDLRAVS